jgi:transcriptional regulator with XRE-family HTH domain
MGTRSLAPQLQYVEEAHEKLGLTYRQIAGALGADESTLHRWRSGESEPRAVSLGRMEALHELQTELLDLATPESARRWLFSAELADLDGQRPVDLITRGQIEPLVRILLRMNLGMSA